MINKTLLTSFLCLLYAHTSSAIESATKQDTYEEILQLQNQLKETKLESSYHELNIASWPRTRPFGTSKTITVSRYSNTYDLYMWWEQGYLFAEAVPLSSSEAFICGAGWSYVQNIGNTVTMFDTTRFEDELGDSICQDFSSPIVFVITQWDLIFDYYVDFNQPFNLVRNGNPYDLVKVDGGITLSTTSTAPSSVGTISPDLTISIPSIQFRSLDGTSDIYLELRYNGETVDGLPTWALVNAGYN
jgi:hypothetical protein